MVHGVQPGTPLHVQETSISCCAALTFRYSGTELENPFSLFVSADLTGSVPVHMTARFQLSAGPCIMHP